MGYLNKSKCVILPCLFLQRALENCEVLQEYSVIVLAENLVVELYQNHSNKNVNDIQSVSSIVGFGPVHCYGKLSS
jgi:hypothetical protein